VSIDKVIINTPSMETRLSEAKQRKVKTDPLATYLQQGAAAMRTLIVTRVLGSGGLRALAHLDAALAELDIEATTVQRTICSLDESLAAEAAMRESAIRAEESARDEKARKVRRAKHVRRK
jgi:hypothetical protein